MTIIHYSCFALVKYEFITKTDDCIDWKKVYLLVAWYIKNIS
jgi:hypothetical protein